MATVSQTAGSLTLDQGMGWSEVARSAAVWRYLAFCMLMGTCLLFYTWSRIDARETALALDRSRSQAALLQTEHDWLELELATLQDVGVLQDRAGRMGLVDAAKVRKVK